MNKIVRFFVVILSLTLVFALTAVVPASALTFDCDVEQYSDTLLMVNLDTGMEVYAKEADAKRYPAALTKVMTYIIAAEHFDDFDTKIPIKQSCIDSVINQGMSCSGVDWYVGETLTVENLLYAMMLPAGHDAAMVFADYIGEGNVKAFVDMMNAKAEELGCTEIGRAHV